MPETISPQSPEQVAALTLEQGLQRYDAKLTRLESELGQHAGSKQYPEWYDGEDQIHASEIRQQLAGQDVQPEVVARYYDMAERASVNEEAIMGYEPFSPLLSLAVAIGPEKMVQTMHAESAGQHMRDSLIGLMAEPSGAKTDELQLLQSFYDTKDVTGLLAVKGEGFADQVHDVIRTEQGMTWMRYADQAKQGDGDWDTEQERANTAEWTARAISAVSGLSNEEAAPYAFSASINADNEHLLRVIDKFDHFGAERIQKLSEFTNIYGLEGYSIPQLERMERLMNNPAAVADELRDKDVTVTLINRVGDHNGVLRAVADNFDDGQDGTLLFEINRLQDISDVVKKLNKLGIQPSTLVLAAHSNEGQFMVSDDRERDAKRRDIAAVAGKKLVAMANAEGHENAGDTAYSIDGMDGLARLTDDFMKAGSDGKRKIIFAACYMGKEVSVKELDEEGQKVQIGVASVASKLAEKLQSLGAKSDVEVFGGADGIQMHRTEKGVKYSGQPADWDSPRSELHATKISLIDGKITKQEVDEIALRA